MPRFAYNAFQKDGRKASGTIQAETKQNALSRLEARELTPIRLVEQAGEVNSTPWWNREITSRPMNRRELAVALRAVAQLLIAGLPLTNALKAAQSVTRDRKVRDLLQRGATQVAEGGAFADAFSSKSPGAPEIVAAAIAIAEEMSALPETLREVAHRLEGAADADEAIRSAMTYPIVLLLASLFVLALLTFGLAPAVAPAFVASNTSPPWILQSMIDLRALILISWRELAFGALAFAGALFVLARQAPARRALQSLRLRSPIVGAISRNLEAAAFSRALAQLLKSGAPALTSVRAARNVCSFELFRRMADNMEHALRRGEHMFEIVKAEPMAPRFMAQAFELGERGARLPELLDQAAEVMERQALTMSQRAIALLAPALTIIVGVLVGWLVFSVMTALLSLNAVVL